QGQASRSAGRIAAWKTRTATVAPEASVPSRAVPGPVPSPSGIWGSRQCWRTRPGLAGCLGLRDLADLVENLLARNALFHGEQGAATGLVDDRDVDPVLVAQQRQVGILVRLGVVERHEEETVGDLGRNADQRAAGLLLGALHGDAQHIAYAAAIEAVGGQEDHFDDVTGRQRLVSVAADCHAQLHVLAGN